MFEPCEKFPSLDRRSCAHCQGSALGTQENPNFSVREGFDEVHGYPVIEILKNGGSIHQYDAHFRFGRRKAEMLLTCLRALKEFGWCAAEDRLQFRSRIVEDPALGLRVRVFAEMQRYFERSTGQLVHEPWLRLHALPPDQSRLGLGVMKCRAIWSVQDELRGWLGRHP